MPVNNRKINSKTISTKTNQCVKCSQSITEKRRPGISCYVCNKLFHSACVDLPLDCLLSIKDAGVNWACPVCKAKSTSRRSTIYVSNSEEISENTESESSSSGCDENLLRKLSLEVKKLTDFQFTAENSLSFFSGKCDEMESQIQIAADLSKRVESLERDNLKLKETIEVLENRLADIEQNQLGDELVLSGVPELEQSLKISTEVLVERFAESTGCPVLSSDLRSCKRLRFSDENTSTKSSALGQSVSPTVVKPSTSSSVPRPSKILLNFYSTRTRDEFKSKLRSFKKSSKFVNFCDRNVDFYVSDHLSKHFNHLFFCAKNFARENNFSFVWVKDSQIYLKKDRDGSPFLVKNLKDLMRLRCR